MKCNICPLFTSWSNESDSGEACGLFGDGWDSPFQYEDKLGTVVGCYIDKHLIVKHEKEYDRELENRVKYFLEQEEQTEWLNLKSKELIYRVESDAKGIGIVRTYVGELVRCKDCQWFDANDDYYDSYCDKNGIGVEGDFYCGDGVRRPK